MAQKQLSEMSLEELNAKEKKLKNATTFLVFCIAMLFGAGIFLTIVKGFNTFTVLPFVFLGLVVSSKNELKKVQAEIKSRQA
jgi:hypothetical protein